MNCIKMNSSQYSLVCHQIDNILHFLTPLLGLANCHTVDYFTKNLYSKYVEKLMADEISQLGYAETIETILKSQENSKTPTLNSFINKCKSFSLYHHKSLCLQTDDFYETLKKLGGQNLPTLKLNVFVKEKKSHEIEILSSIAASVRDIVKSSHVIDVGDGKGYLSSMLSFHYNVPVLGVDASTVNTEGAIKRANKLGRVWRGLSKNPGSSVTPKEDQKTFANNLLYKQVTQFVMEDTNFVDLVSNVFIENCSNLGLVGLHTCGNLASTSLKIYTTNKDIKSICNVSCCYHLLTERDELDGNGNQSIGFPMSQFVIDKNIMLGRSVKMLSAQSIDRILNRKELPSMNVFYRSVLQVFLNSYCIDLPEKNVGRTKIVPKTFVEYARKAFKKLEVNLDVSDKELNDVYELYSHRQLEMHLFYLLRCFLAPVIESLILLDKLLFLYENGHSNSYIVQLFDPVISPRCYGIISLKS